MVIKQHRADRGLFWSVKDDQGELLGAFTFLSPSDQPFVPAFHNGTVSVHWSICHADGSEDRMAEATHKVRTRKQATKWARQWFRSQDCRNRIARSRS